MLIKVLGGDVYKRQVLDNAPADAVALEALMGEEVTQLIASVGENMQIGKFARHTKPGESSVIGQYIHANGKIGVLVFLTCGKAESAAKPEVLELAKNLAMQVAAASPLALDAASQMCIRDSQWSQRVAIIQPRGQRLHHGRKPTGEAPGIVFPVGEFHAVDGLSLIHI